MKMSRRDLVKLFAMISGTARAQQAFHAATRAALVFHTTKTVGFHPSFTKTGATLYWKWPDGTYTSSNAPTKTLAAGTKRVEAQSQDGFSLISQVDIHNNLLSGALPPSFAVCAPLTYFDCSSNSFTGTLPSFAACTSLTSFYCSSNSFTGTLPSFAACTSLSTFVCSINSFTGTLPSFAACTSLSTFLCYTNSFSGTLPSFAACTSLSTFECHENSFTGTLPSFAACPLGVFIARDNGFSGVVAGSFSTQEFLSQLDLRNNLLPDTAVNQVLADCVASLGIPGRGTCTVSLEGTGNAAPTGQGLTDKATLITAGWTVATN